MVIKAFKSLHLFVLLMTTPTFFIPKMAHGNEFEIKFSEAKQLTESVITHKKTLGIQKLKILVRNYPEYIPMIVFELGTLIFDEDPTIQLEVLTTINYSYQIFKKSVQLLERSDPYRQQLEFMNQKLVNLFKNENEPYEARVKALEIYNYNKGSENLPKSAQTLYDMLLSESLSDQVKAVAILLNIQKLPISGLDTLIIMYELGKKRWLKYANLEEVTLKSRPYFKNGIAELISFEEKYQKNPLGEAQLSAEWEKRSYLWRGFTVNLMTKLLALDSNLVENGDEALLGVIRFSNINENWLTAMATFSNRKDKLSKNRLEILKLLWVQKAVSRFNYDEALQFLKIGVSFGLLKSLNEISENFDWLSSVHHNDEERNLFYREIRQIIKRNLNKECNDILLSKL